MSPHDFFDGSSLGRHGYQREYVPSPGPSSVKSLDMRSPYTTLERSHSRDSAYSGRDTSNSLDRHGHLNILGLSHPGNRTNDFTSIANGRTSPYPRDNVKDTYTKKYEERISTNKPDEGLYPPYRALYTYIPQNEDELELREGDIVFVMEKCDDGWYVGTSQRTKEFGTFPGNYVQRA